MSRGCKKLAQKLTCMDTSWEPYESEPDEFQPPPGETSTVRDLPPPSGQALPMRTTRTKRTTPRNTVSIATRGLKRTRSSGRSMRLDRLSYRVPLCLHRTTGTSGTQHEDRHRRKKSHRDRADVGYTPNMLSTQPKRARKPKALFTPGS